MDFTEGSSFLLNDKKHLWAIISDLTQSTNEIVIVNIATYRNLYEDTACIVEKGEHRFIRDKSYVFYHRSRVVNLSKLQLCFRTGELKPHDQLKPELLNKIRAGAKETEQLPFGVERILSIQGLI